MKCDQCGYRPQRRDAQNLVLDQGKDNLDVDIIYVRCYQCGHEWIE